MNKTTAFNYMLKGANYHYKGDIDNALTMFKKARIFDPNNTYIRNQIALIFLKKWNKTLAIDKGNKAAIYYLHKYKN